MKTDPEGNPEGFQAGQGVQDEISVKLGRLLISCHLGQARFNLPGLRVFDEKEDDPV